MITREQILNDPSASNWLKENLTQLEKRDICDALDDLELLNQYFQDKWKAIAGTTENQ